MVPSLLLLATAHALVLPDVVEDVADAVQFQIPVANASAALQGGTAALDFEVGGHLALHAHLPTALAENPAWLPDTEQIKEFSPKQAGQRLGFFVSAHVIAWMLLCLIGTAIMTRCCGRCTDPSGFERVASAARPLESGDVWRAFFGTYLISLVAVFASLRFSRLSKATGLDFEVYLVLFVMQGTRLLWQAVTAIRSVGPASRFPIDTFTLGTVAANMPFMADSFDTLKDVVFGALCIMSEHWALRLAGFASLVWLPCVHYRLLRDIEWTSRAVTSPLPARSQRTMNLKLQKVKGGAGRKWRKVCTSSTSKQLPARSGFCFGKPGRRASLPFSTFI
ncbi:Nlrc3 [Symbiodinium sp. CCMP2592]|nr:Nlrc3 [Symbiodinium sp. CCMP2592]